MSRHRSGQSRFDEAFDIVNHSLIWILFFIIIYPLIYVASCSFSLPKNVAAGRVWLWPVGLTLDGYRAVFTHELILSSLRNSVLYVCSGTLLNLFMTAIAAYPLSRKDFYGRNVIMFMFVFTLLFSGGLIPNYILLKDLHLINTPWVMIIPTALSSWNVIITRTFFQHTIPSDLLEAAQLDGCSDIRFLQSIVLPLSKPITAVMGLFYAVGHWNSFLHPLIYLHDVKLFPLQVVLRDILVSSAQHSDILTKVDAGDVAERLSAAELLKYSLIIVSSVPMLIVYPFVQKHFVKGIMIGSLKG